MGRNADAGSITVLIPAYNEAASIADTLHSLNAQTRVPDRGLRTSASHW